MKLLPYLLLSLVSLTGDEMATRFLRRTDPPLSEYISFRHLEARNERFHVTGWLEACVTQSRDAGFQFSVRREGGSAYVRNKVLRKALEGEQDLIARGEPARAQ